ncbi:MAG: C-GCAxxG-C-C family protein [Spirochaetes bacterium]|nr:C-GCAxxG-C-C family protein [Spirochaetota bacterium]
MTKAEKAVAAFQSGYNCAQSTFMAFVEDLGMDKRQAMKLAAGFGGGMGRMQEVCGAVTGGILALGATFGHGEPSESEAQKKTYTLVQELMRRFEAQHKSCLCRNLVQGIDLKTEEGQKQFKERDLRNKVCVPCVRTAVEIVEELRKK